MERILFSTSAKMEQDIIETTDILFDYASKFLEPCHIENITGNPLPEGVALFLMRTSSPSELSINESSFSSVVLAEDALVYLMNNKGKLENYPHLQGFMLNCDSSGESLGNVSNITGLNAVIATSQFIKTELKEPVNVISFNPNDPIASSLFLPSYISANKENCTVSENQKYFANRYSGEDDARVLGVKANCGIRNVFLDAAIPSDVEQILSRGWVEPICGRMNMVADGLGSAVENSIRYPSVFALMGGSLLGIPTNLITPYLESSNNFLSLDRLDRLEVIDSIKPLIEFLTKRYFL